MNKKNYRRSQQMKYFSIFFQIETQQSMKNDIPIVQNQLPSRDNFPKGLRGGGACYDW